MTSYRIYTYFLIFLALTKDYIAVGDPIPGSDGGSAVANALAPPMNDDGPINLLQFVNPCAIAAAVFGVPAAPYVIPCTILRRIRLFRETFMPNSSPMSPLIGSVLSDRQKLILGNLILAQTTRRKKK